MAFLVLLLAVLSRVLPALLHTTGGNVTMVGAGLLFFGSRLRADRRYLVLLAVVLLAASDYWLTVYAYGFPFKIESYLPTWLWYAAVPLAASARAAIGNIVRCALEQRLCCHPPASSC